MWAAKALTETIKFSRYPDVPDHYYSRLQKKDKLFQSISRKISLGYKNLSRLILNEKVRRKISTYSGFSLQGSESDVVDCSKEIVKQLRKDWKRFWKERFDDHIRGEDTAIADYSSLFVDLGTIIYATRDFKDLKFKEILESHQKQYAECFIQPDPHAIWEICSLNY